MSNHNPDRRDRAEQTVDYIERTEGIRYLTNVLLGKTHEGRYNAELPEGTLQWLDYIKHNHSQNTDLLREYIIDALVIDDMVGPVESAILDESFDAVAHRHETGTPREQATLIESESLPDYLAGRLLQSEIGHIEGRMMLTPDNYESLIMLNQALSERTDEDTAMERKALWDQLLKFTRYQVRIRYGNSKTGEELFESYHLWRQSNAEAHNDALRGWRRKYEDDEEIELINIDTVPDELRRPSLDPLDDIETWVRREFW